MIAGRARCVHVNGFKHIQQEQKSQYTTSHKFKN